MQSLLNDCYRCTVIHVAFFATPDDSGTKASTIFVESWAFNIRNTTLANAIIFKRNTN